MDKTGWNIEKATMVDAPVFTDFPMTLECRIKEKYDESETGYYLVAEIVNILVDEKYLAEDGNPDMQKMKLIVLDPIHHGYIQLGDKVGNAFSDGKALKIIWKQKGYCFAVGKNLMQRYFSSMPQTLTWDLVQDGQHISQ